MRLGHRHNPPSTHMWALFSDHHPVQRRSLRKEKQECPGLSGCAIKPLMCVCFFSLLTSPTLAKGSMMKWVTALGRDRPGSDDDERKTTMMLDVLPPFSQDSS